ncbi:ABC transporter substrate-binding protein [Cryptosporangium aurantiacum]|uniref:Carbohydrate ABC transporter substrate-binding protein, CUT1 family n=1 Tax=Cryptosporangium aurantiacum TaxID=134849 RepID=A0A1M7MFM5_9ACTN|nr:sugar ABC transporter substrate-binding protein [Cryptosporangium aurantiacum]SHM89688.1 carbohydrate ABC transporter substrate-binding protein, CUT1 family [Cryptosporangium aurantiacum]
MRRSRLGALVAAGLVLAATGCTSADDDTTADGKVRITVNCEPPKSAAIDRRSFEEDIAIFEKQNPDIDIVAHDAFPCMDPKTFDAKLAGDQMETIFYVYFTDVANVVKRRQAADISKYVGEVAGYDDLQQSVLDIFETDGKTYGLPRTNYSMGLVYNKALFTKAGLDASKPPTTWDEVRVAAKKIAGLGNGTVGYADFSASNQGGWHFTAEMYSQGGSIVSEDGKKATVDSPEGKAVLQTLKDMRWTDNSMGSKQLLQITDVQQMMGSGKLGMYLAAPDNLPEIVKKYKGSYNDLAIAPMPGNKGTLLGGDGYMFNKKATPEQIKAGVKWVEFQNLTPGTGANNWERAARNKAPVGLPQPNLWTGATADADNTLKAEYANVPVENYRLFQETEIPGKLEPPQAQQIYSVMDGVMSAVLTNKNADIDDLLADASDKIDRLLANQR